MFVWIFPSPFFLVCVCVWWCCRLLGRKGDVVVLKKNIFSLKQWWWQKRKKKNKQITFPYSSHVKLNLQNSGGGGEEPFILLVFCKSCHFVCHVEKWQLCGSVDRQTRARGNKVMHSIKMSRCCRQQERETTTAKKTRDACTPNHQRWACRMEAQSKQAHIAYHVFARFGRRFACSVGA